MFNVGDEVLCTSSRLGTLDGCIGIVTDVSGEYLSVLFPHKQAPTDMFKWRFELADPTLKGLSTVCLKIRQMEKRWQKFQERKGAL